jgi:hypothetical protein
MADAAEPAASSAPPVDEFAAQKANIRDTAKWMATAFAAVGGVVIAGTPFSGLGTLDCKHLAIVLIAGGVSLTCTLVAICSILNVLIGSYAFAGSLEPAARNFINENAKDILPIQFNTLEEFLAHRETTRSEAVALWRTLTVNQASQLTTGTCQEVEKEYLIYLARSDETERNAARIVSLAHLFRMRNQLDSIRELLVFLTVVSVISLVVAVWSATSVKKEESGSRQGELMPRPALASATSARWAGDINMT